MKSNGCNYTFITAAFGTEWHQIVKGLARTFAQNNASKLIIYTDATNLKLPNCMIENNLSLKKIQNYAKGLPIRSAKPLILLHAARKYGDICWIDADMLIFTDLSSKLHPKKINVIPYGYGDNLRDCGANLKVPQKRYAMSGFFAAPKKFIINFERIWRNLQDDIAKSVTTYDQSVLNHLIERNKHHTKYLTKDYPNMIWNFAKYRTNSKPGAGHPRVTNKKFCSRLTKKNDILYFNKSPIALLYWTSNSLKSHMQNDFKAIHDPSARKLLMNLYK